MQPVPTHIRAQSGLTLPEILVTIAIVGILLTAGLPALNNMVGRYQTKSAFHSFTSAVSFARSEAIIRRQSIAICPRDSSVLGCYGSAINSEETASAAWKNGWIVFVDRSDSPESIDTSNNDQILKVFDGVDLADISISKCTSTYLTGFRFNSRGGSDGFKVRFLFSDDGEGIYSKVLIFDGGRTREAEACS